MVFLKFIYPVCELRAKILRQSGKQDEALLWEKKAEKLKSLLDR